MLYSELSLGCFVFVLFWRGEMRLRALQIVGFARDAIDLRLRRNRLALGYVGVAIVSLVVISIE